MVWYDMMKSKKKYVHSWYLSISTVIISWVKFVECCRSLKYRGFWNLGLYSLILQSLIHADSVMILYVPVSYRPTCSGFGCFRSWMKLGNISVTGKSNLFQEFYYCSYSIKEEKTTCYFKHCSTMSDFLLFKRLLLVRYFVSHPCHFDQICFPSPEKNQSIGIDLRKEIWKLKLIIDCVI